MLFIKHQNWFSGTLKPEFSEAFHELGNDDPEANYLDLLAAFCAT